MYFKKCKFCTFVVLYSYTKYITNNLKVIETLKVMKMETSKSTKTVKATSSKSTKSSKVAKAPENVKHNIRKGMKLNTSEKTIQKQFQKMEELLLELKPKMQKLHCKTVAIDNKAVPGGWAKIEFDASQNILKCTATNSEDKEPRYISIFEYEMLHKEGLKQYKEWKKSQSK